MVVMAFFVLTGCVSKKTGEILESTKQEEIAVKVETQVTTNVVTPVSDGETEISSETLFLLMTAELAGQRSQYELALDSYLHASEQVKNIDVIKRATKIALYIQDDKKLKKTLDLWLDVDPESLDARYLMVVNALRANDKKGAVDYIDYILIRNGSDLDVKGVAMIKNLKNQQSVDLAYQVFSEASARYPNNAKVYFLLSLLDARANRGQQAESHIAKALQLEPHWVKAMLLQSQLYIATGNLSDATHVLQRAVTEKENLPIREQIAQLLMQQLRFEEAENVLQDLIDKLPENKELKFKLALAHLQTGKGQQARNILQGLVEYKSYRDKAAFYLARVDAQEKHYDDALQWFAVVQAEPFKREAEVSMALILMDQKRYEEALVRVHALEAQYSEEGSEIVLIKSEIYSLQGLDQEGFDALSAGLLAEPENVKILYARALVAEKLGNLQVLEDDLHYILEKNPKDVNALNALGYTLVDKTARYDEAKIYLDKAIALQPNEPIILDSYGWLLFKQNKLSESLVYIKRAYGMQPLSEIAAHLVEILWALQQKKEAQDILSNALVKMPDDELLLKVKLKILGNH